MSLLQDAYRTYDNYAHLAGVEEDGKVPLGIPYHTIKPAHITITLDGRGTFCNAECMPDKPKTIMPELKRRTSDVLALPLCDQLNYVASYDEKRHTDYCKHLSAWAMMEDPHPTVMAVWLYVQKRTIVSDLEKSKCISLDELGRPLDKFDKFMIRWRMNSSAVKTPACWKDASLHQSFEQYYAIYEQGNGKTEDRCYLSGEKSIRCDTNPAIAVLGKGNAGLVSSNRTNKGDFTFLGRFSSKEEAYVIGNTASQKAHHMIQWLCNNESVTVANQTFFCWRPNAPSMESPFGLLLGESTLAQPNFISYREDMVNTLKGYKNQLNISDEISIAAIGYTTKSTGRLSILYYNNLPAMDFVQRIEKWYQSLQWIGWGTEARTPSFASVIYYAYAPASTINKINKLTTKDKDGLSVYYKLHMSHLLTSMLHQKSIPFDIVQAIGAKVNMLLLFDNSQSKKIDNELTPRDRFLWVACAIIRKHHNDRQQREVFTLALDKNNKDRSYLYGRLLAIAEVAERRTYDKSEKREPNAIRMQAMYSQRPAYGWRLLEEQLQPYFSKLSSGSNYYYRQLLDEVLDTFEIDDFKQNKKLDDTYILGYHHQRQALRRFATSESAAKIESEE